MNPAYMIRQMNEEFPDLYGISGHITSLKLMREENAPDPWETNALMAFENGSTEVSEYTEISGKPVFRLMKPLYIKEDCLKCHGDMGYQVGDVRGGIGVTISLQTLLAEKNQANRSFAYQIIGLWILGVLGIFILGYYRHQKQQLRLQFIADIQRSEKKYRLLAENISDVIWIYNLTTKAFKYISPSVYQLRGVRAEDALNESLADSLTPESLNQIENAIPKRIEQFVNGHSEIFRDEVQQYCSDGHIIWIEIITRFQYGEDKTIEALGVSRDITRRKQDEQTLHQYEAIISTTQEHMSLIDTNYIYRAVNNAYLAAHSLRRTEIINHSVEDLLGPEVFNHLVNDKLDRCLAGENIRYQDWFYFPGIEGRRYMDVAYNTYKDAKGTVAGVVVTSRDSTDMKHAEEKHDILEAKLRKAQKLEVIGTMVRGVAHEFNNSLQSLFLYADIVKEQLPEDKVIKEDFDHLLGAANDAKRLVEQVMLVSSPDLGDQQLIDLPEVITEVLNLKITPRMSNIKVELNLGEDCPQVFGDKGQIKRVIENVLDNAILALEDRGILGLSLKCETSANQPGRALLTISDTGVGMTEDTLNQIFNPFFTTREIGRGKGFGLSIVYNILQNMGASITATSVLGEGSSFLIEFPLGNL